MGILLNYLMVKGWMVKLFETQSVRFANPIERGVTKKNIIIFYRQFHNLINYFFSGWVMPFEYNQKFFYSSLL